MVMSFILIIVCLCVLEHTLSLLFVFLGMCNCLCFFESLFCWVGLLVLFCFVICFVCIKVLWGVVFVVFWLFVGGGSFILSSLFLYCVFVLACCLAEEV